MLLKTLNKDAKQAQKQEENGFNFNLIEDKGLCQYLNFANVQKVQQNGSSSRQIKISNRLCRENGQFLQKITQIKFNNEIITIRDRYKFSSQCEQNNQINSQKRVHIFKKPLHIESKLEGKRRVTKNLPKNFIKAFLNFLQQINDEKKSELLSCKMKLLTSRQKYNNSFIQRIVDDSDLQPYFMNFLANYAKDWIENSKIRDKDVHYEAIQIFKKLSNTKNEKKNQKMASLGQFSEYCDDESRKVSEWEREQNQSDKQSIIANSSKSQKSNEQ